MAWRTVTNPLDPVRVLSDDHVEHIHLCSLRLLASTGDARCSMRARAASHRSRSPGRWRR
jgi:trimethylamine:corrinoid methyltransferase-like protein